MQIIAFARRTGGSVCILALIVIGLWPLNSVFSVIAGILFSAWITTEYRAHATQYANEMLDRKTAMSDDDADLIFASAQTAGVFRRRSHPVADGHGPPPQPNDDAAF